MDMSNSFNVATTQGHAFFVYGDDVERLDIISEYFRQGLDKNELCIFVTPETTKEAITNFKKRNLDVRDSIEQGSLRIFEMNSTYLPNGQFVAEYMLSNVRTFIEESKAQGFSGLRTAGEMSWLNDYPESSEQAADYERKVNDLVEPNSNFVGLCLYPMRQQNNGCIKMAASTHPTFILDDQAHRNPAFAVA
jgi:hypothetical protein